MEEANTGPVEKLKLYGLFKQATKGPPNPNPPEKGRNRLLPIRRYAAKL